MAGPTWPPHASVLETYLHLLGNGDGTFLTRVRNAVGIRPYSQVSGDFNSAGRPDLATAHEGYNDVSGTAQCGLQQRQSARLG